jgi:hypothetical protein
VFHSQAQWYFAQWFWTSSAEQSPLGAGQMIDLPSMPPQWQILVQ